MRIAVVSRSVDRLKKHLPTIKKYKRFISSNPDIVIAVGGDGTFLAAERYYPGIPKLLIRDDSICNKCDWDNLEEGLKRLLNNQYRVETFHKIEANFNGITLEAVNDIVVRNASPTHAIRFRLWVDKKPVGDEFIGDGIVVSTVFGSEGYFRSITKKHFETGLGIAFNNITENCEPLLINQKSVITIQLTRGIAHIAADNNPHILTADKGDKIKINQSKNKAKIVRIR